MALSATIMGGSLARARAIATRCCCPPGHGCWPLVGDVGYPDLFQQLARSLRSLARFSWTSQKSIGSMTFSTAVSIGRYLKELEDNADVTSPPLREGAFVGPIHGQPVDDCHHLAGGRSFR